jgi:hypothetical protein
VASPREHQLRLSPHLLLTGAQRTPVGDDEARAAHRVLDLPDDALVVVVTAGSLGLGGVAGALLLDVLVLEEHVATTSPALVGEILSTAVVVGGTIVTTRHSAAVLRDDRAGVPAPAWG